jgi:hypothetical protein
MDGTVQNVAPLRTGTYSVAVFPYLGATSGSLENEEPMAQGKSLSLRLVSETNPESTDSCGE